MRVSWFPKQKCLYINAIVPLNTKEHKVLNWPNIVKLSTFFTLYVPKMLKLCFFNYRPVVPNRNENGANRLRTDKYSIWVILSSAT